MFHGVVIRYSIWSYAMVVILPFDADALAIAKWITPGRFILDLVESAAQAVGAAEGIISLLVFFPIVFHVPACLITQIRIHGGISNIGAVFFCV